MRSIGLATFGISVLALGAVTGAAAELKPEATAAYDRYVRIIRKSPAANVPLEAAYKSRARAGEIVIHNPVASTEVPGALIHDWTGTTFIPGARVEDVVELLRDFDHHAEVYDEVIGSKLLQRGADLVRGRWQLRKKKLITVVLNVDMEAHYRQVSPDAWVVNSWSTRIAEVADAGKRSEHEISLDKSRGFLWRLDAHWWVEQSDGGVYVVCRTISMSRRAPTGLGWLIKPMILDAPRESLVSTLEGTRDAIALLTAANHYRSKTTLPPR